MPMPYAAASSRHRRRALALTVLLCAACSTDLPPAPVVITPQVPASLLSHPDLPAVPPAGSGDATLSLFILQLWTDLKTAYAKMDAIRRWQAAASPDSP